MQPSVTLHGETEQRLVGADHGPSRKREGRSSRAGISAKQPYPRFWSARGGNCGAAVGHGEGRAGGSPSAAAATTACTDAAAGRAATTAGRAGKGIEGANAATAWSARTEAQCRRVDFAQAGRSLIFSKLFCPGLLPRCLALLRSLAASGEGDALLTSSRTWRRAGVELAVAWGEGVEAEAEAERWTPLASLLSPEGVSRDYLC